MNPLEVSSLVKRFGDRVILDQVELTVGAAEIVAIVGESGSGKSTLLNLIAGLESADAGDIRIDGVELGSLDDDGRTFMRRRSVGFVFQAFHLLPYLDVAGNVGLPLDLLAWASAERAERVAAMLSAVGLGSRSRARLQELSGGEQQRVAVARALAHKPRLVLADEPTGNLDTRTAGDVLGLLLNEIRAAGAGGLMVTHSSQAARRCDRVVQIVDGRVLAVP